MKYDKEGLLELKAALEMIIKNKDVIMSCESDFAVVNFKGRDVGIDMSLCVSPVIYNLCSEGVIPSSSKDCFLSLRRDLKDKGKISLVAHPVSHPTLSDEDAFFAEMNIWTGEYGENRFKFVEMCIEFIDSNY